VGGTLALVRDGDEIELDVPGRSLTLCVDDAELERRRMAWRAPEPRFKRGWGLLFSQNVTQAHEGCDFELLASREPTPEPSIHRKV
jgi:dihydroxy-acid dehydratase